MNEHHFVRPYAGLSCIAPVLSVIQMPDGTSKYNIIGWESDNVSTQLGLSPSSGGINIGPVLGADFCLTKNLYIGFFINTFIGNFWQADEGRALGLIDVLAAPFIELGNISTMSPVYQLGLNLSWQIPPKTEEGEAR